MKKKYKMRKEPNIYVGFYGINCYAYNEDGGDFQLLGKYRLTQLLLDVYTFFIVTMTRLSGIVLALLGLPVIPVLRMRVWSRKEGQPEPRVRKYP